MKTAFISIMALASTFIGVMSAPAAVPAENSMSKRNAFDPLALISGLSVTLQPSIDSIEKTTATISASSTDEEKAAASSAIAADISTMVTAVQAATAKVPTTAAKLIRRQVSPTALGEEIVALLQTVSTAVNGITAALGLTATLALLNPLTLALSNLLLALEVVVNDLLVVVQQLVDGLLTGLATGLAGLVL